MVLRLRLLIAVLLLAVIICACGGKPLQYTDSKEQKPGPGLFSGEDGVFTLIKIDKEKSDSDKQVEAGKRE